MKQYRNYVTLGVFCLLTLGYQNCGQGVNFGSGSSVAPSGDLTTKQTPPSSGDGSDTITSDSSTTTTTSSPVNSNNNGSNSCKDTETQSDNADKDCYAKAGTDDARKACDSAGERCENDVEDACENDDDGRYGIICRISSGEKVQVGEDDKVAFLQSGHSIPDSVCMSPNACLVLVNDYLNQNRGKLCSKQSGSSSSGPFIQYTHYETNGVCSMNPHVLHFTDDQVKAAIQQLIPEH